MTKHIKCPFCEGVAAVKLNAREDPFISCPRCGPINARGAKYRAYIAKHEYERAEPVAPNRVPEQESEQDLAPVPVASGTGGGQTGWLEQW